MRNILLSATLIALPAITSAFSSEFTENDCGIVASMGEEAFIMSLEGFPMEMALAVAEEVSNNEQLSVKSREVMNIAVLMTYSNGFSVVSIDGMHNLQNQAAQYGIGMYDECVSRLQD